MQVDEMGERSEFNRREGGKKGKNTRSVRVEVNSSVIDDSPLNMKEGETLTSHHIWESHHF